MLPVKDVAKSSDSDLNLSTYHSKFIGKVKTGRINGPINPSNLVKFYQNNMFWFHCDYNLEQ